MKKPTMKAPVKKGSKRVKRFDEGGLYSGDDEIVKYRMGQIKDPGVDLFKLVRGEEQVAKPIPLDKKQTPVESKEETKTEYKEDLSGETTKDLDPYDAASKTPVSISKPNSGGKTSVKTPVKGIGTSD